MNPAVKSLPSYRSLSRIGVLLFLIIAGELGNTNAQKKADLLEPGKTVTRELAGGESHSYEIPLTAGQFLSMAIEQRGINVILILHDPKNKKIAEIDAPNGSHGPEQASLIADVTGAYRLEVLPAQPTSPRGHYDVSIKELRAARPQDETRVSAERIYAEATLIAGQGGAESWRKAIEKYQQTIPLWQSL